MEKSEDINLKEIITKNNYVLAFSIGVILSFLLIILRVASVNLGKITQVTNLFPISISIILLLAFLFAAVSAYYKKYSIMFIPLLIWILVLSVNIRTSNISGLKDVTTGDWTLGPDLDPFLYLRHAYEIEQGKLQDPDLMRVAPLGVKNYALQSLMPWSLILVHKIIQIFGDYSLTYAAIIAPVIFFILSTIGLFLFVRSAFSIKYSKRVAEAIAILASLAYVLSPQLLHRTVAGIPEIESLGMIFFWFTLYFFTLAWINKKQKRYVLFGLLAGLCTGLMSYSWGGYRYLYMVLGLTTFVFFLFEKDRKKNFLIFSSWIIPSLIFEFVRTGNFTAALFRISDTGFAIGVFALMLIDFILSKTKIKHTLSKKINLPDSLISIIVGGIIIILGLLVVSPKFIVGLIPNIIEGLLYPFGRSRIGLTVAENKAPYLTDVLGAFGLLFWLFLLGCFLLFINASKHFKKKERFIFNGLFLLFLAGVTFTRISSTSMLNGENALSKFLYLGSIIVFAIGILYFYIKNKRTNNLEGLEAFKNIDATEVLLLSLAFFTLISIRGAIRLFFIVAPIIAIISSIVPVIILYSLYKKKHKDEISRLFLWIILIVSALVIILTSLNYAQDTYWQTKATVPSTYNQQWQKAMAWVRENTSEDSIFVHWWDYGYWVQTLGERPTVTDGGHQNWWWDHTTARYLLTTPRPETALSLMKTHQVSYLLIDSTDIGKYSAYSSIGSDDDGIDRLSWIQPFIIDQTQVQETRNGTLRVYRGGIPTDEDIIYDSNGTQIFLPYQKAGLGAILFETQENGETTSFKQPQGIYVYNGKQYNLPIRYLEYEGNFRDFQTGINATVKIIPLISSSNGGIQIDPLGTILYLSPKVSSSLFAQLYLMNDPQKQYPTINLAHSEDDPAVAQLKVQGANIKEFIYYQGVRGPIKIWNVNYPENILSREEFLGNNQGYAVLDNLEFTK